MRQGNSLAIIIASKNVLIAEKAGGPFRGDCAGTGNSLVLHIALAMTTEGIPLGIVPQILWARDPDTQGKSADRKQWPIKDKGTVVLDLQSHTSTGHWGVTVLSTDHYRHRPPYVENSPRAVYTNHHSPRHYRDTHHSMASVPNHQTAVALQHHRTLYRP